MNDIPRALYPDEADTAPGLLCDILDILAKDDVVTVGAITGKVKQINYEDEEAEILYKLRAKNGAVETYRGWFDTGNMHIVFKKA